MRPWIWKLCVTDQYLRRMNLLGIWQIQNVEQVRPVSIPTLSAPETFNFFFKNTNYCTKLKICMRPWIWKLCVTDQYLRRMNLFGIWQIQNVEQVRPVSLPTLPVPETSKSFFKNTVYFLKMSPRSNLQY